MCKKDIIDIVTERVSARHLGDKDQLEVIFSSSKRILVEAPAGYGKTNTMVSKVAYMLASQQIPYPKKLLALTFSVNAAYKIKKDVSKQIPDLLKDSGLNIDVGSKIFVSNYHGFCRNILKKYGHKFQAILMDIDKLQSIDDTDIKKTLESVEGLLYEEAELLSNYGNALKNNDQRTLNDDFNNYNNIVIKKLLPAKTIPYNGILSLTIKLFVDYPKIKEFYQKYFTTILVDEFQDTNTLSYWLLGHLVNEKSKVILLGDPLQRIYGFIGAVPNLLSISEKDFNLIKLRLKKNYRFASNPQMLLLDLNIRKNAENPSAPIIEHTAKIDFYLANDQSEEAVYVVKKTIDIIRENPKTKVAILVKQRGANINNIIETFNVTKIPYFFGLFTDEDVEYTQYNRKCLYEFIELIKNNDRITKNLSKTHRSNMKKIFGGKEGHLIGALMELLNIFWDKLFIDYSYLSNDEKIVMVKDTFENNSLKQYIEFVESNVIISTVHAAKGLEWDYVILPDMEQDLFPNWFGLCGSCVCKVDCNINITSRNEQKFLEELSVFYVAVTRAKRQVYFSASKTQLDKYNNLRPKHISCFIKIPGIHF